MNGDDLQRMAQDAGLVYGYPFTWKNLEDFANLVATAEREACAQIAETAFPFHCDDLIRAREDMQENLRNMMDKVKYDWPVTKQTLRG